MAQKMEVEMKKNKCMYSKNQESKLCNRILRRLLQEFCVRTSAWQHHSGFEIKIFFKNAGCFKTYNAVT